MTSLEFVAALRPHGYLVERSGVDRITVVRSGDHRRVSIPPNQVFYPRTLRLLLLAADVDEAAFDVPRANVNDAAGRSGREPKCA
jgi:hypothetical protein